MTTQKALKSALDGQNKIARIGDEMEAQRDDARREIEWLWANCRIIYFPPDKSYPIEHTLRARKDSRKMIEEARDKWSNDLITHKMGPKPL